MTTPKPRMGRPPKKGEFEQLTITVSKKLATWLREHCKGHIGHFLEDAARTKLMISTDTPKKK